jgi:hypothetical protein
MYAVDYSDEMKKNAPHTEDFPNTSLPSPRSEVHPGCSQLRHALTSDLACAALSYAAKLYS